MAKLLTPSNEPSYKTISTQTGTQEYAKLREEIIAKGILDRDYRFYFLLSTGVIAGFLLSLFKAYTADSIPFLILWSIAVGFFGVQIGGLMHDAGHRTIFTTTKTNDMFGHFFSSLIAFPFFDWTSVHNQHHAHPNQDEEDPDIELPFISLTKEQFLNRRGISKLIRPFQAYYWYPFGSLVSLSKRFYAYKYFMRERGLKTSWQLVIFAIGIFVWFLLPFLLLPFSHALIVVLVSNLTLGFYMANIFAPNHKGMPQIAKGVKLSFLEHQIITTRNIYGHWLTDFVFLGLNYQIEHHLFPNCPRNKLNLITPFVKDFCRRMNLEFTEVSVLESNKIILSELNQIASTSKKQ